MKIAILGVAPKSNYKLIKLPGLELDLYDEERDLRNFDYSCPVITHAPCAQWSRLRKQARVNEEQRQLAFFCYDAVRRCGGIFEHPSGSQFMREVIGYKNCISVDQHWWNYPTRKRTYLYFNGFGQVATPLNFDHYRTTLDKVNPGDRSTTTMTFNLWLIFCIIARPLLVYTNSEISEKPF